MCIMKHVNATPRSLQQMVDYLSNHEKTGNQGVFGIGVNPEAPAQEMQFVQDVFCREGLKHPYIQVIFSFDTGITLSPEEIQDICIRIGQILISDNRQVFGAIHSLGTNNIHCHYMINAVGIDGSLYQQGHHVNYFKHKANEVLREYGLPPIKVSSPSIPFGIRK